MLKRLLQKTSSLYSYDLLIAFQCLPFLSGFFIDINLFKANKEKAAELGKNRTSSIDGGSSAASGKDGLADEDANLMIKLKFLTYKVNVNLGIHETVKILFLVLEYD